MVEISNLYVSAKLEVMMMVKIANHVVINVLPVSKLLIIVQAVQITEFQYPSVIVYKIILIMVKQNVKNVVLDVLLVNHWKTIVLNVMERELMTHYVRHVLMVFMMIIFMLLVNNVKTAVKPVTLMDVFLVKIIDHIHNVTVRRVMSK